MCAFMIAGSSIQQAVETVIALPAGDRQVAVDRILWRAFVAREYRAAVRTALSRRADICLLQADNVLFSDDGEAVMRIVDVGDDQITFRWRGQERITRRAPDELAALLTEGGFQRALPEHAYSWWTTWARTIPPHEPPEVEISTKSTQIVVRRLCHRALYANLVDMEQQPIIAHEYTASILEYLLAEEAAMSIVATADATDQYQRRLKARLAESRRLFPPGQWQSGDIREWALGQMQSGAWFRDPKPKTEQEKPMASIYTEDVVRGWYARLAAGEITQEALAAEVGCSSATISVRLKNLGLRLPSRRATTAAPVPARAEAKEAETATARKRQRRQQARKSPAPPVEVTPAPTSYTAIVPASSTPPTPSPNGNSPVGDIQLAQAQAAAEWLRGLLNELQGAGAHVSGSVSVELNLSVNVPIGPR